MDNHRSATQCVRSLFLQPFQVQVLCGWQRQNPEVAKDSMSFLPVNAPVYMTAGSLFF